MGSDDSQAISRVRCAAPSTRRCYQFFGALYIHAMVLAMLAVFSRNAFSAAIRTVVLPLIR